MATLLVSGAMPGLDVITAGTISLLTSRQAAALAASFAAGPLWAPDYNAFNRFSSPVPEPRQAIKLEIRGNRRYTKTPRIVQVPANESVCDSK